MTLLIDPAWALLGKQAIPGRPRGGTDVRQLPEFEALQAQLQQALSASTAGSADWEKVVEQGAALVSAKSKDLLIAGYWAVGLIHTHQLDGFLIGAAAYLDLLENFWDHAFPALEKPKLRARAINWWLERSAAALRPLEHRPVRRDEMLALLERFRKAAELTRERLEESLSWSLLTEKLERFTQNNPPPTAGAASAAPTTAAPAVSHLKISTDDDAKREQTALFESAGRLGAYWQSRDPAEPLGYRLNRFSAWFSIRALPPSTEGRTRIAPPESREIEQLSTLRNGKLWEAEMRFAESATIQFIFWLDLQRASVEALEAQGERFAAAAEAVRQETAAFLARLPGLAELAFADGMPFADEATRSWLAQLAPAHGPADVPWPAVPESDMEAGIREDIGRIKPLLKTRKFAEAARAFQDRLKSALSARERFLCRLEFAQALAKSNPSGWFAPQAERILEDIDTYRLVEFDPALALKGITRVLKGYQAQSDAISKKRSEELYRRLAQIDLTEFVRQGGTN